MHVIFLPQVTQRKLYPWTALVLLTTLNFLNYIDRSVLFAVQPLVQDEFHLSNAQLGYLTSAFLIFYMIAAPFVGPLADRYSRKLIIILGAIFWSGLTLLTAVTHTYGELLLRHTLVGIGEATFVTIAPTFVADLFSGEETRPHSWHLLPGDPGAALPQGICWEASWVPCTAGDFRFTSRRSRAFCWRSRLAFVPEPERGRFDSLKETRGAGNRRGLARNPAFWTATLGMAMMTFSLGGIAGVDADFPLTVARGYSLEVGQRDLSAPSSWLMESSRRWREAGWETACCRAMQRLLLGVRGQHGAGRAGDDCRPVFQRASDVARQSPSRHFCCY